MRYEAVRKKGRCHNDLIMCLVLEYLTVIFQLSHGSSLCFLKQGFPVVGRGIWVYADSAEFVIRYEVVEEKGRCFAKGVLYLLGVRNVVTTIEREVMLVR